MNITIESNLTFIAIDKTDIMSHILFSPDSLYVTSMHVKLTDENYPYLDWN